MMHADCEHLLVCLCVTQGLSRKGLHVTAFEVAKVLMLLDPDDPMGAIFCIDYFALRSQNYRWLQVSPLEPVCTVFTKLLMRDQDVCRSCSPVVHSAG